MTEGTTRPLEIPKEMRAVAEQSVEQAKLAFNSYLQAAQEAVSAFDRWVKASQVGTQGITKKAMSFAERNVLSAFEFAQKIVQAKDIRELIRMQTEFVQSQIQVLSEQVKDLGETATEVAKDSLKDLGERATKTAKSVKDLGETRASGFVANTPSRISRTVRPAASASGHRTCRWIFCVKKTFAIDSALSDKGFRISESCNHHIAVNKQMHDRPERDLPVLARCVGPERLE